MARVLVELTVTAAQIYQRSLLHCDHWASEPQSTGDAPLAQTCARCAYVCIIHAVQCIVIQEVRTNSL